jgi:hypothetical protein
MSINFSQSNLNNMLKFLNNIRNTNGLYIELIYDENTNSILYASQYFLTQKMDKFNTKQFKQERRKRSYSEDEKMILKSVLK